MSTDDKVTLWVVGLVLVITVVATSTAMTEAHGWRRHACIAAGMNPPPNAFITDCSISLDNPKPQTMTRWLFGGPLP